MKRSLVEIEVNHRKRRSPQGERGLKQATFDDKAEVVGRSPQGERGLKQQHVRFREPSSSVAPRKGSVG